MIKQLDSILFATNLTPNCQAAYEHAVGLSLRYNATVYILYVIEVMPDGVEGRLRGLLGRHKWEDIIHLKEENVRKSLTGKVTSAKLLEDIRTFCQSVGARGDECTFQSREVIVSAGDVAETILESARENACDVIILASREGVLSGNHLSDTIKTVLKEAPIPVLVVPSRGDM